MALPHVLTDGQRFPLSSWRGHVVRLDERLSPDWPYGSPAFGCTLMALPHVMTDRLRLSPLTDWPYGSAALAAR